MCETVGKVGKLGYCRACVISIMRSQKIPDGVGYLRGFWILLSKDFEKLK